MLNKFIICSLVFCLLLGPMHILFLRVNSIGFALFCNLSSLSNIDVTFNRSTFLLFYSGRWYGFTTCVYSKTFLVMTISQQICVCSDMEIKNKVWQVAELEEYRNIVLVENQQLKEIISGLQSKVQNLENSSFTSYSLNASAKVCFLGIYIRLSYFTILFLFYKFYAIIIFFLKWKTKEHQ